MLSSSFLQELNPFSSCSFVGIKHTPHRLPGLPFHPAASPFLSSCKQLQFISLHQYAF